MALDSRKPKGTGLPDKSASPCCAPLGFSFSRFLDCWIPGRQNDSPGDKITLNIIPRPDIWDMGGKLAWARWSFTPCTGVSFLQVWLPPRKESQPLLYRFSLFSAWRFPGIRMRCPCDINRINHTMATMGEQGVITVLTATMTRDFYFYWPRIENNLCLRAPFFP